MSQAERLSLWARRNPILATVGTAAVLLLLLATAVGAWDRKRDPRALVILAGPLAYFALLHMVFASSMRYRIPAEVPGMGLAALGLGRLLTRFEKAGPPNPGGPGA